MAKLSRQSGTALAVLAVHCLLSAPAHATTTGLTRETGASLLPRPGAAVPVSGWPPAVEDYRALLNALSKNTSDWAQKARALRLWMQANDPDYPLYHLG